MHTLVANVVIVDPRGVVKIVVCGGYSPHVIIGIVVARILESVIVTIGPRVEGGVEQFIVLRIIPTTPVPASIVSLRGAVCPRNNIADGVKRLQPPTRSGILCGAIAVDAIVDVEAVVLVCAGQALVSDAEARGLGAAHPEDVVALFDSVSGELDVVPRVVVRVSGERSARRVADNVDLNQRRRKRGL